MCISSGLQYVTLYYIPRTICSSLGHAQGRQIKGSAVSCSRVMDASLADRYLKTWAMELGNDQDALCHPEACTCAHLVL